MVIGAQNCDVLKRDTLLCGVIMLVEKKDHLERSGEFLSRWKLGAWRHLEHLEGVIFFSISPAKKYSYPNSFVSSANHCSASDHCTGRLSLTWRLSDLGVIMAVADLDGGQTRGGDPLLDHHGAVVGVGLKQLP